MSSRSQRNFQMKNWHLSAIVVGIILALIGLYFIFGISSQTDAKNARCTEKTTGVLPCAFSVATPWVTDWHT